MMKRLSLHCLMTAFMVCLLTSCQYKDLEDVENRQAFTVGFSHERVDSIPALYRLAFYPIDQEARERLSGCVMYDVSSSGASLSLPSGLYNVTAWNNDCEHIITSASTVRESAYATTGQFSPHGYVYVPKVLDSLYQSQRVLDYPDYMTHANHDNFRLVLGQENQHLTLNVDSMVVTIEVKLNGVKGLEYCQNVRGAVNNVAGKRFMAFPNRTEEKVAVMFDAEPHKEDSCVTARFWVFGIEPTELEDLEHRMVFFFWITGNQVYASLDVSDIIARARKEDTYIFIDTPDLNIDLSEYVRMGSTGMVVDAEDWNSVEINLNF